MVFRTLGMGEFMSRIKNGTKTNDTIYGLNDSETINSGSGNDAVYAGNGNDIVNGGSGNDTVFGDAGDDVLNGGSGRDSLYVGGGHDIANGGDGDDSFYLSGVGNNDSIVLNGDAGDDRFFLSNGPTEISVQANGGEGDDVFSVNNSSFSQASSYVIQTGTGVDKIDVNGAQANARAPLDNVTVNDFTAGVNGDVIRLDSLMNWAQGYDGTVNPFFSATRYVTVTQSGADTLLLFDVDGAGTEYRFQTILRLKNLSSSSLVRENFEYQGINYLTSGAPNGTPITNNGANSNQTISGGTGGDSLNGAGGNDIVNGSGGNDFIQGGEGNDTLNGGSGADQLYGQDGNDVLNGDGGDDYIDGSAGDDTLNGGSGNDQLYDTEGNNSLNGGAGDDFLYSENRTDNSIQLLDGGSGDDTITVLGGHGVNAAISAGEGEDDIRVTSTFSTGNGGNVTIATGAGVDTVSVSGTRPVFGELPTNVIITDFTAGEAGDIIDLLPLMAAVSGYDGISNPFNERNQYLRIAQHGSDVLLQLDPDGSGNQSAFQTVLTFQNLTVASLSSENFSLNGFGINPFVGQIALNASALNETIQSGSSEDSVNAGSGDDIVFGGGADDVLNGDAGNDQLYGDFGDDVLNGGAGRDRLFEYSGNNILSGGEGDDFLSVEVSEESTVQMLNGGAGDDDISILGGFGVTATVNGGEGDDNIQVNSRVLSNSGLGTITINTGTGVDIVGVGGIHALFKQTTTVVVINDFTAGVGGDVVDLLPLISYTQGYDGVTNPFAGSNRFVRIVQNNSDVNLQFDVDGAGTEFSFRTVLTLKNTTTSSLVRENFSYNGVNFLPAGSANAAQVINNGASTNQTINGNTGDDNLNGAGGNDVIRGLAGRDSIFGGEGNDTIEGGSGSDTLSGDDGDDVINGESGDDFLSGGSGNDVVNGGTGRDTIYGDGGSDALNGGDGDDILFAGDSFGAIVSVNGDDGDDQVYVRGVLDGSQIIANGGAGDDLIQIEGSFSGDLNASGLVQVTTGSGSDTISIDANKMVFNKATLDTIIVTDFQTGTGGDVIDLSRLFVFPFSSDGSNPFAAGFLRLVQSGSSVLLQFDRDARGLDSSFQTVVTLLNVDITTFLPENFNPPASPYADPPTVNSEIILGTSADDILDGLGGDDAIYGLAGSDRLMGGAGNDTLLGGLGDDTYLIDDLTDSVIEKAGEGNDTVRSTIDYELGTHVENLVLTGSNPVNGTGNSLSNFILGNSAANVISGLDGNDTLDGGNGNDQLFGGAGDDRLIVADTGFGTDLADGGEGNDTILVSSIDGITAVSGQVTVIGGAGNDSITVTMDSGSSNVDAGIGDDFVSLHTNFNGSTSVANLGVGNDTVALSGASHVLTLGAGSDLVITNAFNASIGLAMSLTVTDFTAGTMGDKLDFQDYLKYATNYAGGNPFQSGHSRLSQAGADTLLEFSFTGVGGSYVQVALLQNVQIDQLREENFVPASLPVTNLPTEGADSLVGTAQDDVIEALGGDDTVEGLAGNDTLNGGAGNDTLKGGLGNDVYIVDSTLDQVIEATNEGNDSVLSSVTFTLAVNVENLTLTGNGAINATGNTLANVLIGNDAANSLAGGNGNDILIGGGGNDRLDGGGNNDNMRGGTGNDTYVVNSSADAVIENAAEGDDTVSSSISYTLGANLERLALSGGAALNGTGNQLANFISGNTGANILLGGEGNDTLSGLNGNDTLDGGTGNDSMNGGAGDDTFFVDSGLDQVIEAANSGSDTVNSLLSYTLGANLENLNLVGQGQLTGTGNTLNNVISGNTSANILDGGIGVDTLMGGAGNDTYIVENVADVVVESSSSGTDTVLSSVSYTLGNNVERLTLTGSSATSGTGNSLANTLNGNTGNNQLNGGAGNDRINGGQGADEMIGGTGNDTYWVDNAGDTVIEVANEGIDSVNSSVSYQLADFIENLTALAAGNISLTGNSSDNRIIGNSGNNTLVGDLGSDLLVGGAGGDRFVFTSADDSNGIDSMDSILDFLSGVDVIDLSAMNIGGDFVFIREEFFDETDASGQIRFESGTLFLSTNADSEAELVIDLVGVAQLGAEDLIL